VNKPDREWFKRLPVLMIAVVGWFVVTVSGELIGNQANDTTAGQTIGHYLLLTALVVAPLFLALWGGFELWERRRRHSPIAADETAPPTRLFAPPSWHEPPKLCGRRDEVARAVKLVRDNGIVAVVGERDVGTSAVGLAVAQELIDHDGVDPRATTRFDLRSRSASAPDDALTTAARLVSVFGIDEPADETVLPKLARELVGVFRASDGTLLLDNVNTAEQVAWLVQEWPAGGPRLVVVGETALGDLVSHSVVKVDEMSTEDMRRLWRQERPAQPRRWLRRFARNPEPDDDLDELLTACLGRPRAVKALAHEVSRPGSPVRFSHLLNELRHEGPATGTFERVWRAILTNLRAGLSDDAVWLLSALAGLPVTGLIKGAVAAMLGVSDPVALEELRSRNLVDLVDGRYRLPQEYRRAIEGTTSEEERRAVAARALPALLGFYRTFAELWAARLETDPAGAGQWFEESEPSFRPLYTASYGDLLLTVLDDLCAIADALARWYVRAQLPAGMLAVHTGLHDLAVSVGWRDVAAHAAIRTATAHRMAAAHGAEYRFGAAVEALDNARTYIEQVADQRIRTDLDVRERSERALVAIDRGTGLAEAFADVASLEVASPAVLINRGVLYLERGALEDALELFLRAEELAVDAGDQGAEAHSVELQGVVLSHWNLVEAVRAWQQSRATFTRIGERQGQARCLQHLAAAALADPRAAGQLLRGEPEPADPREAASAALTRLLEARSLRPRQQTPLTNTYIQEALTRLH
jgi:tetratricopeptide (TPR) repeat protein